MGDQNTPIRLSVVSERGKKRRNSSRQFCKKGKYIKKTKKNYDGTEALLDDPLVAYSAASSVPSRGEASRVHSVQAWLSSSSAKSGASRVRFGERQQPWPPRGCSCSAETTWRTTRSPSSPPPHPHRPPPLCINQLIPLPLRLLCTDSCRFLSWVDGWIRPWSRSRRCRRTGCPWTPPAPARRPATPAPPPSTSPSATRCVLGSVSPVCCFCVVGTVCSSG